MSYIIKGTAAFALGAIAGAAGMVAYASYDLLRKFQQVEIEEPRRNPYRPILPPR
jgi:hypothetical protein